MVILEYLILLLKKVDVEMAIVQTILSEAGKIGVKKSYLQVVNNNETAKNIYKKLGCLV
jgi:hypothetical protein